MGSEVINKKKIWLKVLKPETIMWLNCIEVARNNVT